MTTYIIRRLIHAIPLLLLISLVVFVMISFAPGGPMAAFEENPNLTPEDLVAPGKTDGSGSALVRALLAVADVVSPWATGATAM